MPGAFTPHSCSKYVPARDRGGYAPRLPNGPAFVDDPKDLRCTIPDASRQFAGPASPAVGGAADGTSGRMSYDNRGVAGVGARITGVSPSPLRHRGGALNDTQTTAGATKMVGGVPPSYESRDWQSLAKTEFQGHCAEVPTAAMQAERKRIQMSSSVPVGLCKAEFPKTTHSVDFYKAFAPQEYATAAAATAGNRIGGPNNKSRSDVRTGETAQALPGQYASMSNRQFPGASQGRRQDAAAAAEDAANKQELRKQLNRTHWSFGLDRPEYKPMSTEPLPSTAPLIKNRPPSAGVSRERNIFVAHSAEEARPPKMSAQEVAASKAGSNVPIHGAPLPSSAASGGTATPSLLDDATSGGILPRRLTSNAQATPVYQPVRREQLNVAARNAAATMRPTSGGASRGGSAVPLTSDGLCLGTDRVDYAPMSRAQYPGVYFKSAHPGGVSPGSLPAKR